MADKGKIMAAFLGVGTHMWGEYDTLPDTLDFDERAWEAIVARFARAGGNMILLDVGEGVVLPSVPELAVKGAWTPERVAAERERLAAMGIELIPKLNFSTTHDAWLGEYSRMVSTSTYYRVCEAAIRDVVEIFGHPRFVHLGYDEESQTMQRGSAFSFKMAVGSAGKQPNLVRRKIAQIKLHNGSGAVCDEYAAAGFDYWRL